MERIKQIFIDDPYANLTETAKQFGLTRHQIAKIANSVRALDLMPAKNAVNIVPEGYTGKVRRCLKCKQDFVVTENYYRCLFCRRACI